MSEARRLPDGLATMPPDPQLAAALAGIDPAQLNGHHLVELAPAYVKLISHFQARLLTVLNQIQHSPPGDADSAVERTEHPHRWAELEIAAKLHWSPGKASYELRYAHQLTRRLPIVHAALAAGIIDINHAHAFVDGLACLDDEPAQQIAATMLAAGAPGWNRRQLAARLRRACIAHDPHAATRRQRDRQANRRVQTDEHPDGTTDLYGLNLPPQRVAEIMERVSAIARATKHHGDYRTMDQLMADVLCDLLAGTGIAATPPAPVTNPDQPHHTSDQSTGSEPAEKPAEPGPGEPRGVDEPAAPTAAGTPVPLPGPRRGVVELQAPLSTLLGLSQAPGTLGGWQPVIADIVRQLVTAMHHARWRFSIYDDATGQLLHHGITGTRPDLTAPPETGFAAADVAFVRARDRTCRAPHGCGVPATACDTDHTLAKVDGGRHHRHNAGPLCKRDHRFKHESGATLHQPQPGTFQWTTPLGHHYTIRPEPYDESTGPPES